MSKDVYDPSQTTTPRKGRHSRTPAVTGTSGNGNNTPAKIWSSSNNALPTSTLGLPPGVDPLTLDADDAFSRFSVREVQSIESSLRTSHDSLTSRLRLLVSERYRDMLGTANTLIDMSDSSSNLVGRLENVLKGIQHASDQEKNGNESLTGMLSNEDENVEGEGESSTATAAAMPDEEKVKLFAIVATTKLISEAPDEVWVAVDSAIQTSSGASATQSNGNGSNKKEALSSKELSNFRAATILRATWIFVLAQASYKWLQDQKLVNSDSDDIQSLFPYISRQRATLLPMRNYLINAAKLGLSGGMNAAEKEISTSYLCTITSLISLSLLQGLDVDSCRADLLEQRKETLIAHIKPSRKASNVGGNIIVQIIRFISDTLIHTIRAFAIPTNGENLSSLYDRLQNNSASEASFPPTSISALLTLPSAAIYSKHLPEQVCSFIPERKTDNNSSIDAILQSLREWSTSIREEILSQSLPMIVEKLSTIAQIGEIQSGLWSMMDRCIVEAEKYCKGQNYIEMIQNELFGLVKHIEMLLVDRIKFICQENGEELSTAILDGTRVSLEELNEKVDLDQDTSKFLFETSAVSDISSSELLEQRLRSRTQKVQDILTLADRKASAFNNEIKAYSASVKKSEQRRKKRKDGPSNGVYSNADTFASLNTSLQTAKSSITKGLQEMAEDARNSQSRTSAPILFLIRLISALRHSTIFSDDKSTEDADYSQELAEVQSTLLNAMIDQTTDTALKAYEGRIDPNQTEYDSKLPSTTSSSLMTALTVLSRTSHSVGFGYRSEAVQLRRLLMEKFCESWITRVSTIQDLFDLEYLRIIMGIEETSSGILDSTKLTLSDNLNIKPEEWSQNLSSNMPATLSRTRLVVASIMVNEAMFTRTMNQTKTSISVTTAALPILPLAKAPEPIPRIKPFILSRS